MLNKNIFQGPEEDVSETSNVELEATSTSPQASDESTTTATTPATSTTTVTTTTATTRKTTTTTVRSSKYVPTATNVRVKQKVKGRTRKKNCILSVRVR